MIAHTDGAKSLFAPMQLSSGAPLRLNCYVFFQKDQACTCFCRSMLVALSNICV